MRVHPRSSIARLAARVLLMGAAAVPASPVQAQSRPDARWNGERVLDLVEGARGVRQATAVDSTFRDYRSRAQGFVYFFLDRTDEAEHTLIKADQLVLDVYWRAPDQTRQRIVGMRDEKRLPTNINYHLDHLTVVQDDFGDLIRIGDGDEVEAVLHPVAPGSEAVYDYRLADSLSLNYAGLSEPIRVYEVQVRPRDLDAPGFVGALYLDRGNSAIVRMAFTFTAASYVDPYLDYIRISLDNALWLGKHWLPYRQEVELRRELPQLDFMAGSIIRGRWEIGRYSFNEDPRDFLFQGPRVTAAPRQVRENFDFEDGLYADLEAQPLGTTPDLDEIKEQARSMAVGSALRGLAPARLYIGSFSDVVRRNRVEGWSVGAGTVFRLWDSPWRLTGGYAFSAPGPRRVRLRLEQDFSATLEGASVYLAWNEVRDMGPLPSSSRFVNTLATLGGVDYTDPYWVESAGFTAARRFGSTRVELYSEISDETSAELAIDDDNTSFRPVRPIEDDLFYRTGIRGVLGTPGQGGFGSIEARYGSRGGLFEDDFGSLAARFGWSRWDPGRALAGSVTVDAGWASRNAPPQDLFLLGGRGTVPGFDHRSMVGDRYVLAQAWVRRPIWEPWVSGRITGAAGWTRLHERALPEGWTGDIDAPLRGSLGFGVDLLWEVLQLDAAKGLPDGDWTLFFSVTPRFGPWL